MPDLPNLKVLREEILSLLPQEGRLEGVVRSMALTRFDCEQGKHQCFYRPMFALVVQGSKKSLIGAITANYGPGETNVVSLDLPGVYQIADATPEKPFLSVSVLLDRAIISDLLLHSSNLESELNRELNPNSVIVSEASEELLDAVIRLVKLARRPERHGVLLPMLLREIHYLLLCGPQREALAHFCSNYTYNDQIVKAIDWLREHFREPVSIDALAKIACMAPSTFHKHFKDVTSLSAMQFQKRLRLHEAQRLLLAEGLRVESVAANVGYESTSQFSREYKRLFGASPRQDLLRKTVNNPINTVDITFPD